MDEFMTDVTAARLGAACLGARSPWTTVAAAGAAHALGQSLVLVVGRVEERGAALWPVPVPQTAQHVAQQAQSAARTGELPPMTGTGTGIVNVTRKPKNVHKTRINAGGYGAMGPHPERERLA